MHTDTEWHNVVVWRNLPEVVGKYFKKGSAVYLEGKIKTRSYEDKEGIKKYITEIIAENLIMLDKSIKELMSKVKLGASLGGNEGNLREYRC